MIDLTTALISGHGRTPATGHRVADLYPHDWIGLLPFTIPWWAFAAPGVIVLAVAIATVVRPELATAAPRLFRTTPGFLAILALAHISWQFGIVSYFDGLITFWSPYGYGMVLCLVAAIVSLRRWQSAVPSAPVDTSQVGRVASAVLIATLLVFVLVGVVGSAINQVVYVVSNGHEPPVDGPFNTFQFVWAGRMPVDLPWWFTPLISVVYLAVVLVSLPVGNRFVPRDRRVRRTTPGFLAFIGMLLFAVELAVTSFYDSGNGGRAALVSVGIALVGVVVAVVRALADVRSRVPAVAPAKKSSPTRKRAADRG